MHPPYSQCPGAFPRPAVHVCFSAWRERAFPRHDSCQSKAEQATLALCRLVENGSLANIIKPNKFGPFPEALVGVYLSQVHQSYLPLPAYPAVAGFCPGVSQLLLQLVPVCTRCIHVVVVCDKHLHMTAITAMAASWCLPQLHMSRLQPRYSSHFHTVVSPGLLQGCSVAFLKPGLMSLSGLHPAGTGRLGVPSRQRHNPLRHKGR